MTNKNDKETKPFYYDIENRFWRALISPFCVCFEHKLKFFIWVSFVIVASLFGTLINLIPRVAVGDWKVYQSLCADSASGSFYTISLVLIASLLPPIFNKFINEEKEEYTHKKIGVAFLVLLIISMMLYAVFFAVAPKNDIFSVFSTVTWSDVRLDFWQLLFIILAILFAWYSFGYVQLSSHEPDLGLDDSQFYNKKEDKQVSAISNTASTLTDDGHGNNL